MPRHVLKGVYGDPALHLELATARDEWEKLTPCELHANASRWLHQEREQVVADCVAPEGGLRDRTTRRRPGQCPSNCFGHGTCVEGKFCRCDAGYQGEFCSYCRRSNLPECGQRCEIAFCTRRISAAKCTPTAVRKLVRFRCNAPRRLEAAVLVELVLSSRPVLIGRAGNVELKMIAGAGLLLHELRVSSLDQLVSGLRSTAKSTKATLREQQEFVFGRVDYMMAMARNSRHVPGALTRFVIEYTRALAAADLELAWDEQCREVFSMRCHFARLERSATLARNWPSLVGALGSLPRTFGRMVQYNTSVSYWLDVLEGLARRRTRLLVVTGFAASVRHQIPRLRLVHPTHDLSGLSIRVLAAPLVFPGFGHSPTPGFPKPPHEDDERYDHYLDTLLASPEWDPSLNDVAILGCGFFGMPLASRAKRANLSAIYVGGLIQLLFGITGRRYLDAPVTKYAVAATNGSKAATAAEVGSRLATNTLSGNVNEHWIAPLASETPSEYKTYEKGAYW